MLALKTFLCRLRVNLVLSGIMLTGTTNLARYTTYADDFSMLVTSSAEIDEVEREIWTYETVISLFASGWVHGNVYLS